jgi:succinate-semialdehyde dehydrogenase/glutarate-semialdehyde dehydrogenase
MSISTTNPVNNEVLKTFLAYTKSEIETRLAAADAAFQKDLLQIEEARKKRAQVLFKVAELLDQRKDELARMITLEMGKTLKASLQELEKCAATCQHYGEIGLKQLAPEVIDLPVGVNGKKPRAEVRHLPVGVVLAIMPWNFPFWQALRCAAPILLSGNSMLLKHASNVPQCALAIEKLFKDAGLTDGAFQTLLVGSDVIGDLVADARIQGVTLTGSESAGKEVAARAGKEIKKTVLELGGSDPYLVMPSCDFDLAVETAVKARIVSNGQSCVAAKRFIVHTEIYARFKEAFTEKMKAVKMGDPLDAKTELGPLVSVKAREDLHALVVDAVKAGARLLAGGEIPAAQSEFGRGAFYPATLLDQIPKSAKIRQEEAFGPVAALYEVKDLEEAIELANSTRFGLGSSFWSKDEKEIAVATTRILSGSVFVNSMTASDPHLPFGGVKSSGYGRELGNPGLFEFTNVKTVFLA